ncbi:uncharacterized protein LOC111831638 isoform X2 [Capsella rubella]|uniref:uncharacterized protein LOC111831638 isoform X2 n=1 Tax=Capsella rubella TaxID=81985 RepID=UPI000CD5801B|nr:uncharacterized protein LOC111831638 isoform X2 [Capsella rubella]
MRKELFGRAFAGAPMFALGYYTNDALTPNLNRIRKDAKQALAEGKSLVKERKAALAKVIETKKMLDEKVEGVDTLIKLEIMKKKLDDQVQLYRARLVEMEEKKKKTPMDDTQEETEWSFIQGNGSGETM